MMILLEKDLVVLYKFYNLNVMKDLVFMYIFFEMI